MFRKSKRKIVATIMSILVCLFLGTLAVIYASSYFEVANTNFDMLERHAQMYVLTEHLQLQPVVSMFLLPSFLHTRHHPV